MGTYLNYRRKALRQATLPVFNFGRKIGLGQLGNKRLKNKFMH
jgi:hypothetical protein